MKTILDTQKAINGWIKAEATAESKLFDLIDGIASGVYSLDNVHKSIVNVIKEGVTGDTASKVRRFKSLLDLAKRARDKGVIVEPAFKAGNFGAITKELKLLMEVEDIASNLEKPKEVKATKEVKGDEETPKEVKGDEETPKEPQELQELLATIEALKTKAPLLPLKQLKTLTNTLKKYL